MAAEIRKWLEALRLEQYAEAFIENDVDFRALPHLDRADLKELGVSLGHRKVILAAIEAMNEAPEIEPVGPQIMTTVHGEEAPPAVGHQQAERRQLTVMFCDLVGSTELSQRLDPEDLREVMGRYQDTVAGIVARFEGNVAKFLGDGVLSFFGWPRAYEDQAERAVRSGLAAVSAVAHLKSEDGRTLQARVGIATGMVVIGDIVGETATEANAVAGETPNLAARLQGVATAGQIVIGATTKLLVSDVFQLEDLGAQKLKGYAEPVEAWHVVSESAAESRFEAAHPGALTQLVGREHELGLLWRAWEQGRIGIGQVVLVSGEPGIGKSRLVEALGAGLKAEECTRITMGCSPYHTNSALYPLIAHLERFLNLQDQDEAEVKLGKLEAALQGFSLVPEEVIPLFAVLLSLPLAVDRYPPLILTPPQQKQQTLDAVVAWLLEEAERQPVLLVWEDLHWADPSTLELLALVIEQAPTAPVLNVLTFRPEFAPPWPQRSHMTPLTLNRLERPQVEALIGQQADGKALPLEVVEHIVDKTDGVPLYVEELTKAILEADFLRERHGRYELTGPLSGVTIPATLQDSLMARLDRLPTIREVAQLGAVLGREFAYEMLQAIASLEETILQEGLEELVGAELLYRRGRPPHAKYVFKHALVQDAAYQSLLKRTRQYYHGLVAELLESRFPDIVQTQPELVAHHYTEAGLAEQAVDHWFKAGQQAAQQSAHLEAIGHLRKELEVLMTLPESTGRDRQELTLQTTLGPALMATKGYGAGGAGEVYFRARELCEQGAESGELFTVAWGLFAHHLVRAEYHDARELSEQLLGLAGELEETENFIEAHLAIGVTSMYLGELKATRESLETLVGLYDPERHATLAFRYGGFDPGVMARCYLATTLWLLGYVELALYHADEALALMRQLDNPYTLARSLYWDAILRQFVGDWQTMRARAEEAIAIAEEHESSLVLAVGPIMLGWALLGQGQRDVGARLIRQGVDSYRAIGAGMQLTHFQIPLAKAECAFERPDEALDLLADATALVEKTEERYLEAELHRLRGEMLLAHAPRDPGPAERAFEKGLAVARAQGARSLELRAAMSLARLWRVEGKTTEARDLLAPVYNWFTEGLDTPDLMEAKTLLEELR